MKTSPSSDEYTLHILKLQSEVGEWQENIQIYNKQQVKHVV